MQCKLEEITLQIWLNYLYKLNKNKCTMLGKINGASKMTDLNQSQKNRYFDQSRQQIWHNPETRYRNRDQSKRRSRSIFLTEFDKMQKTKALWRNLQPSPKKSPVLKSVSSWVDLNKLKIQYRTQLLRNKSKQKIFQENMEMIEKIQEIPPLVDTWNFYKRKRSPRASTQELKQKNMELIKRIEQTEPKVQNWNFYRKPKLSPRARQRSLQKLKIVQENLKIIDKVESIPPKVDAWNYLKPVRSRRMALQRSLQKQKIYEQNMKIIDRVESIPPRIQSWADIKSMRKRVQLNNKKNETATTLKLEKLKKIIQVSQAKLLEKGQRESNHRRLKTLPDKLPSKLSRQKDFADLRAKMMTMKVKKSKCVIQCWSKQLTGKRKLQKIVSPKITDRSRGILSKAQESKQLKYMSKNLQIPLKIDGKSSKNS